MTYSQEVIDALKVLISKWELIVSGKIPEKNVENFLLCSIFLETNCIYCPIFQKTHCARCIETPYDDWLEHHKLYHLHRSYYFPRYIKCEKCMELAYKELYFLQNLLKEIESTKDMLVAM